MLHIRANNILAYGRFTQGSHGGLPMERFLFAKVEVWMVALVALLIGAGGLLFGAVVKDEVHSRLVSGKHPKYGPVGDMAFDLAKLPATLNKVLDDRDPRLASNTKRFGERGGWQLADGQMAPGGYLLLSRVDGDIDMAVVELVDLSDFSVKKRWVPDPVELYKDARRDSKITDYTHWTRDRFRVAHPYLMRDGHLLVRNHNSPMVRLDACQNVAWMQDEIDFHHSTNMDAEGNLWIPSRVEPSVVGTGEMFNDHSLAKISPQGEVLFNKSMAEILIENDQMAMVFGAGVYDDDPLHMNDIEPALRDGPHWKKGDLFVSMRHRSLVVQYRPSTNEIIWMQQGPWMAQHDVDIIDDHTISIFNNNVYDKGQGWYILGNSNIHYYDFRTGEVSSPYQDLAESADLKTLTEGLYDRAADGHGMIEEENSGRILLTSPQGELVAEFINRADNGGVYRLGWSRLMSQEDGDAALAAISSAECPQRSASLN